MFVGGEPNRRQVPEHATFTTLLMSTRLTFGTISSLYGLNAYIINRIQFSLLVTVVVLSAIVPTSIVQRWFSPDIETEGAADAPQVPEGSTKVARHPIPAGEQA